MPKIDLHTHSVLSPDGGLTKEDYTRTLKTGVLDFIAVTDHNRIDFALELHKDLGDKIIVGEEITAQEGEIIGLYLREPVQPGLSAAQTALCIKAQGGLVYVPHPFETVRMGIPLSTLDEIAGSVDIIETYNGRSSQNRGGKAEDWAAKYKVAGSHASDAHGLKGWGRTYSLIAAEPTRETLAALLAGGQGSGKGVGLLGRAYPKLNRLKKRARHA